MYPLAVTFIKKTSTSFLNSLGPDKVPQSVGLCHRSKWFDNKLLYQQNIWFTYTIKFRNFRKQTIGNTELMIQRVNCRMVLCQLVQGWSHLCIHGFKRNICEHGGSPCQDIAASPSNYHLHYDIRNGWTSW